MEVRGSKARSRAADRPWAGRAALTFVLLTLLTLVVVPILVDRRVTELRAEMEAAEPARTLLSRLQYNMMREMATLTELLLTGDPEYASVYTLAQETEELLLADLEPLTARLGPSVRKQYEEVQTLAARWHAGVAEQEILARSTRGTADDYPRSREIFEQALAAITTLDAAIVQESDRIRGEIRETELTGLRLNALLGVLALTSAAAVAALYSRARRFGGEAERQRREAQEALAASTRADEARIRLLRGFTHDVKNPLGAAKGYAELLATGVRAPVNPEQVPLIEGIQHTIDDALQIIADLLDAARAESGGISVHPRRVDLNNVAGEVVEQHRGAAEAAGHAVVFEPAEVAALAVTDEVRVKQVLGNLLSNAIKYTPAPGMIRVSTEVARGRSAVQDRKAIAIRVSDTGPGIPPDQREVIFDEFTRLAGDSGPQGHGLGLPIARRIARILGGDLTLETEVGPGSTFVLWLPRRTRREKTAALSSDNSKGVGVE